MGSASEGCLARPAVLCAYGSIYCTLNVLRSCRRPIAGHVQHLRCLLQFQFAA